MRNPDYDHAGLVLTIEQVSRDIESQFIGFENFYRSLSDADGHATDHAAERLEHLAKELSRIAARAQSLVQYTNYPPLKA